ncbi:hypothetical protein K2X30_12140 [bacterium]|nr:hypothetical protein [bacterium]
MKKWISTFLIVLTLTTAVQSIFPKRAEAVSIVAAGIGYWGYQAAKKSGSPESEVYGYASVLIAGMGIYAFVQCLVFGAVACVLDEEKEGLPRLTANYLIENGYTVTEAQALLQDEASFTEFAKGYVIQFDSSDNSATLGKALRAHFPSVSESYVQLMAMRLGMPVVN